MKRNLIDSFLSFFIIIFLISFFLMGCSPNPAAPPSPPLAQAASPTDIPKPVESPHERKNQFSQNEERIATHSKQQAETQLTQRIPPTVTTPSASITSPQTNAETKALPVIYYHSIQALPNNELGMPPEQFETQMTYLAKEGYHSISATQLYDYYYNKGTLPTRPILITFDDGYMDNYSVALPIMKKYGFTATLFLIVNKVGDMNCLTWKEVKELAQNGWDIQSHTLTHLDLTTLSPKTLQHELVDSKAALEKQLDKPVHFFAYPSGKYNDAVVKGVKDAGYLMAFSTKRGWTNDKMDRMLVHRVYCFASMGIKEFSRRVTHANY